MASKKRRIIIDCDPGVDDAVMLVLAFGSPELDILGVTAVGGNVPLEKTSRNARMLREICGREDVPVLAGRAGPLKRKVLAGASEFHGESGVGDLAIFEPKALLQTGDAVDFIIDTLKAQSGVTLVITGPMTNVAAALQKDPGIARRIAEIVIMGGSRAEGGNITASAEYNIYADPEAAQIVLDCGAPIVLIGLDATHFVKATKARIARVRAVGNKAATAAADVMQFSMDVEKKIVGWNAPPVHDPCTIAYLLAPELFTLKPANVRVETKSDLTRGHTAVEFRESYGLPMNTQWVTKIDAEGLFDLIVARAGKKVRR